MKQQMNRKILNLAIPNIISNITIPLLGLVDLAILGHLDSEIYLGAVALGNTIFNFVYWAFAFLRMGTSGFTAQAYGKRDLREAILILSRALLFGLFVGLLMVILQVPIVKISFAFINGSDAVEQLATHYFYIRIYTAPAAIGLFALTGWFIGMQNARSPMFIAILISILNTAFNFIFVYWFDMNSNGIAYSAIIAQYAGLLAGGVIVYRYYRRLFKYWTKKAMLKLNELKRFFMINTDIFIRMICVITVFSFFTIQSGNKNDTLLAVNTLLLQYLFIFSFLADGFAYASEALVGKFIGANDKTNLVKVVKYLFYWGIGLGVGCTLIYGIAGKQLLTILTDNELVIAQAKPFLIWITLIPIVSFAAYIWDGVYIGATASKEMRNSMLIAAFGIFLPVYYLLQLFLANNSLWIALILFMASRGLLQTLWARKSVFSKIQG